MCMQHLLEVDSYIYIFFFIIIIIILFYFIYLFLLLLHFQVSNTLLGILSSSSRRHQARNSTS